MHGVSTITGHEQLFSLLKHKQVTSVIGSCNKQPRKRKGNIKSSLELPNTEIHQSERLPPLVTALKASAEQNAASFHFPGHNRGHAAPSSLTQLIGIKPFIHDLPELAELDNLFSPQGPILDAQLQAATLFGSSETWFLVGGTTCGIQAAIMSTCSPGDFLILPRNCHISVISSMVLSGAVPKYIIPEYDYNWDIAGGITSSQVEKAIKEVEMKEGRQAAAVIVTSPTYHGICSNLIEICQLCHSHGIPVIVDEAHGAHLGFHPELPNSALQQGADLVVQSTHKVLCSLTQSSMLHMSGKLVDRERICRCLQTLQSSSPSYLLLASLDAARAQISESPDTIFNKAMTFSYKVKNKIQNIPGISLLDFGSFNNFPVIDPLRLTVGVWKLGLSGYAADEILYNKYGIICELVETKSITFALNLGTCEEHIDRLVTGLRHLSESLFTFQGRSEEEERVAVVKNNVDTPYVEVSMILNPREAFFASKMKVSIEESVGMICGEMICPYPPGIPVMIPGEIITKEALAYVSDLKSKGAIISGASSDPLLESILVCDAPYNQNS